MTCFKLILRGISSGATPSHSFYLEWLNNYNFSSTTGLERLEIKKNSDESDSRLRRPEESEEIF